MNLKLVHWDPAWGPLNEQAMRQRLMAEGFSVSRYDYPPGTCFASHTHAVHKKDVVLRGRLRISWEGGSAILEAGDTIEIPAGVAHSAEVVGDTAVASLDATRRPAS
jgi:quercetin dioxygenase-like cupin family protein